MDIDATIRQWFAANDFSELTQAVGIRESSCCTFGSLLVLLESRRARLNVAQNGEFLRRKKNDTEITQNIENRFDQI